jgi:hypothetical protein
VLVSILRGPGKRVFLSRVAYGGREDVYGSSRRGNEANRSLYHCHHVVSGIAAKPVGVSSGCVRELGELWSVTNGGWRRGGRFENHVRDGTHFACIHDWTETCVLVRNPTSRAAVLLAQEGNPPTSSSGVPKCHVLRRRSRHGRTSWPGTGETPSSLTTTGIGCPQEGGGDPHVGDGGNRRESPRLPGCNVPKGSHRDRDKEAASGIAEGRGAKESNLTCVVECSRRTLGRVRGDLGNQWVTG